MISSLKTFSIDKAFYTSLKKYSQAIGTSLTVVMLTLFLSLVLCGGLGLSFYGLYQLHLTHAIGAMPWASVSTLKAVLLVMSASGFSLGYAALIAGVVKASLDLHRKGAAEVGVLFSRLNDSVPVAFSILLVGIAVFLGLFFLVIPGLFILCRAIFTLYFIVDQDMSATKAIKASWHITRGNVLKIMGILIILLMLSSSVYVLAIPLSWFIFAYMYESLSGSNTGQTEKKLINERYL